MSAEEQAVKEHYAREADRLLNDDLLAEAFRTVRLDAMVKLTMVDADDTHEIQRWQAVANCIDEVKLMLETAMIAVGEKDGGLQRNTPTVQ